MQDSRDQEEENEAELERQHTGRMWTRGTHIRLATDVIEDSVDLENLGVAADPISGRKAVVSVHFEQTTEDPTLSARTGLDWARDVLCVLRREGFLVL